MSLVKQYYPKPHPTKKTFQQLQIPQIVVSNFLKDRLRIRVSQARVSQWLNGYNPIPEHIEKELQSLADQASAEEVAE
jgi:hypothetical protein